MSTVKVFKSWIEVQDNHERFSRLLLTNLTNNGHPKAQANRWARENPEAKGFLVVGKRRGQSLGPYNGGWFFRIELGKSTACSARDVEETYC